MGEVWGIDERDGRWEKCGEGMREVRESREMRDKSDEGKR